MYCGNINDNNYLCNSCGGEGGIRTPDRLAPMPHFECGAFNRSATSPQPLTGEAQITWARLALQARAGNHGPLSRRGFRLQAVRMRKENDVVAGVHAMDFAGDAARKIGQKIKRRAADVGKIEAAAQWRMCLLESEQDTPVGDYSARLGPDKPRRNRVHPYALGAVIGGEIAHARL